MTLKRNATNVINRFLDDFLPPVLRDSRTFMYLPMWLLCRGKAGVFMDFKAQAPTLSGGEIAASYAFLADCHLNRRTDLTPVIADRMIQDVRGESVLDAGCGRGYLAERMAKERDVSVVGLDLFVPEGVGPHRNPAFCRGDVQALPFADASFDTVVCTHTLEHVPNLDQAIRELRRVTRRRLIVVVPLQRPYRYTFDLHLHFFPYPFSFRQVMGNPVALCEPVGNDLYYLEDRSA